MKNETPADNLREIARMTDDELSECEYIPKWDRLPLILFVLIGFVIPLAGVLLGLVMTIYEALR